MSIPPVLPNGRKFFFQLEHGLAYKIMHGKEISEQEVRLAEDMGIIPPGEFLDSASEVSDDSDKGS
eukprot:2990779-Karenia_brevis.AAC.1